MWVKDGWTCDENEFFGLPYVTDAGTCIFNREHIVDIWALDDTTNFGLPYIPKQGVAPTIDWSNIRSVWSIDVNYMYGYPFIMKAESYEYPQGVYVYNDKIRTLLRGGRPVTKVCAGDDVIQTL